MRTRIPEGGEAINGAAFRNSDPARVYKEDMNTHTRSPRSRTRRSPRATVRVTLAALAAGMFVPVGCTAGQAAPPQGRSAPATPSATASGATVPAGPTDVAPPPMFRTFDGAFPAPPGALQDGGSVVNVSGRAEIQARPDRARLSFTVETEATTARAAGEANAGQMDRVLQALRSAGASLPGFRVETSGYSLSPRYAPARDDRPPTIVGYTARNSLTVNVDQVAGLGPLIDTALAAGANRIAGISFGVRDPEPYRREALRLAVANARAEAEVIAQALGLALGPPLEVHGGADPVFPYPVAADMRSLQFEAQVSTPIEAGEQPITANVTIRFRLDPRP